MLKNYLLEYKLLYLYKHLQQMQGLYYTHTSPNDSISQIYYIIINRKWKNSAMHCRSYNLFISIVSNHHIISVIIRLSLRANKKKSSTIKHYDWTSLQKDSEIRNTYI